jgi:hypothetical protein
MLETKFIDRNFFFIQRFISNRIFRGQDDVESQKIRLLTIEIRFFNLTRISHNVQPIVNHYNLKYSSEFKIVF